MAPDAVVVERLRAAGAMILGKTVTTEFACFDPPPTRNPWKLDRTPGGSSSGSAAAMALGMCLGAIGSQTGGSIIRPASYCGVAGCKPTFGRVNRVGVLPVSFHLDHVGPMARTAADCAVLLAIIAGDPPRDPATGDDPRTAQPIDPAGAPPFGEALISTAQRAADSDSFAPPKLGVLRPYFFAEANPEIARLADTAAGAADRRWGAGD